MATAEPDQDPETGAAGPASGGPLARLLELQDADLLADQLAHRRAHLLERSSLAEVQARLGATRAEAARTTGERDVHARRQAELEAEIAGIDARVARIEQRSRAGDASSFRDQEAMSLEIASLSRQKSDLEDAELAEMEAIEPLEAELARLAAIERGLLGEIDAAAGMLREAEAGIDAELAELALRRGLVAAEVDAPLRGAYEALRAKLGGIGVARLVRGACSGCHLSLSATELDRLRHAPAGSLAHCEQCGRILAL